MTTSRQHVLQALNFQTPDRLPKDLGGMRSTSISAFAYPRLVAALGLPARRPRIEDTCQMLALPDLDVLDALDIDVVSILDGVTNAYEQPEEWHPYDFNGRLPALVRSPENFRTLPGGAIQQGENLLMPPASYVFDEEHGGQPLDLAGELPHPDKALLQQLLQAGRLNDEQVMSLRSVCRRVRSSTDRAVFFNDGHVQMPIGIAAWGGLAIYPLLCLTEPDLIAELHEMVTAHYLGNLRALLPEIAADIDILMLAADDWGTQNNLIASPKIFKELFLPYYKQIISECHRLAPQVKVFLHSCGAIYDLIDLIIECGFDILNPVQWPAGGHSPEEWKAKTQGRIALWGGGVNSQTTLPFGSVAEVEAEARRMAQIFSRANGYVFCNIHNILAEIEPEKVITMYRSV
jgi:uroporphyrinogen decarboxylase